MVCTHNLGFPRIGRQRELKFALEKYWRKTTSANALQLTAQQLRKEHWTIQSSLDYVPVGDFSLYDQVLDMSFLLGNVPQRALLAGGQSLDQYFNIARGGSGSTSHCDTIHAAEMTKWFNTNYHYIVPEFDAQSDFSLNADKLLEQINEANQYGHAVKPVVLGPMSYLWLGKSKDKTDKLALLDKVLIVYEQLFSLIEQSGIDWLQIDEPILVMDLTENWKQAFIKAYAALSKTAINKLLTTYFGKLDDNVDWVCELPVQGLHIDAIAAQDELNLISEKLPLDSILSVGIIDGRNIWKTNLNKALDILEPLYKKIGDRLWLAPSCSLLHVPVELGCETKLDAEIKDWLAFAVEKLSELTILKTALEKGREAVIQELSDNQSSIDARKHSKRVHNEAVQQRVKNISHDMTERRSGFAEREKIQQKQFCLPVFPTTTIGSFPQTPEIRKCRRDYKNGVITAHEYKHIMQKEIAYCIEQQEEIGLDILVHGEPERNDMVEYFGEQLTGYLFTRNGWVQSYGSRCVKPPIIYGDISRPQPMTIEWITYAQSVTNKPVKGMLTGPVTILNWSFVRDDKQRSETCMQLALAIRDEVLDLEAAGVKIIQIDEAALREGLPLRKSEWQDYLSWAIKAFRIAANGVNDATQIHTHMCYSEFNDIINAIAEMDADVITIETSRSDMELLDVFDEFSYPNQIGPGIYDIHSPNIPGVEAMMDLIRKAAQRIPVQRLWINPDCGLKTRQWDEVKPALINMVQASKRLGEVMTT